MKRIVSLDFLRGLAMICMIGFHVLIHVSYHAQASNYTDLNAIMESGLLPLFVLIFLLANFRALFLMVSMTVYGYTMTRSILKGKDRTQLLKKNLFFALMLYFVALFTESIPANWGILGRSIMRDRLALEAINRVMHFETLNSIAVSIAVLSIFMYFLGRNDGIKKKKRNVAVFVISAAVIVIVAHFVLQYVEAAWPEYYSPGYGIKDDPADNHFPEQYTWSSVGEFFLKLLLSAFIGVEQPILPFMATTCVGGLIGYLLAQPDVSEKMPRRGMLIGLGLIILGAIVLIIDIDSFTVDFNVFPTWFYLVSTGIELIFLLGLLRMVEFSKRVALSGKMKKFVKKSVVARRWGMISLTLFMWQVFPEFLMRWLGNLVTGGAVEFMDRGEAGGLASIIMIAVVLIVWDLIIRLWEKAEFKGSAEYLMSSAVIKITGGRTDEGKKIAPRMNIKNVLYEPEPIVFVSEDK